MGWTRPRVPGFATNFSVCYYLGVSRVLKDLSLAPANRTLRILGGRWKLTLLSHMLEVPRRFSELERLVPAISQEALTDQLRELEEHGLLVRQVHPDSPPRVEYLATQLGRSARSLMEGLCARTTNHVVVNVSSRAH